ncbi:MAG: hypothetical protein PHU49_03660 [Syntrophorhabdaceae bacterium]|nr:hypothetical protein [Syntrophorhabdaceae bacterium]MDD5243092.1 hypothetical protein [Syntrophorhabdaceae bacterium]
MKYIEDFYKVNILKTFGTGATISAKVPWPQGCKRVAFMVNMGGASAGNSPLQSSVAGSCTFTVYESTAATFAGSAISGATLSIGPATQYELKSMEVGLLNPASNCATTVDVYVNGGTKAYHLATAAATGELAPQKWASALNASNGIPHYHAVPDWPTTAYVALFPKDDLNTGITLKGAAACPPAALNLTGAIIVDESDLSTDLGADGLKYVGVAVTTHAFGTNVVSIDMVPLNRTGKVGFVGKLTE